MQSLQNLVQKFWQETITQEELGELRQLLEKNEHRFKGEMINTFPNAVTEEKMFIEPGKATVILKVLHQKMGVHNRRIAIVKKITNKKMWWAAAASIILIASSFFFLKRTPGNKNIAQYSNPVKPQKKSQKLWSNTGNTIISIELQDGSMVQLYQNSSISYSEPLTDSNRAINLTGKAFFKVAKDKHRPFIVYANGFSTTALGTAFTVNSDIDNVSVKLFEGKVVIKATGAGSAGWKDQYLLPNQKFDYDGITKKYTVSQFNNKAVMTENNIKKPKVNAGKQSELLAFNNEPLKKVLKRLQVNYQVKLLFKDADINGLYFTGTFSKKDDIKNILSIICNISELEFVPKGKQLIEIIKSK